VSGATDDAGVQSRTSRAESFSDAVLAIILTLLVLNLRVPGVKPGRLLSELLEQWPGYLAYVASYAYVAVVWLNHKAAFDRIRQVDRGLHWANLFVLFATALLPFPTAAVSQTLREDNRPDQRVAVALYALVGALLAVSWLTFYHYLARHPDLTHDTVDDRFFPSERLRAVAGFVLYLVGGVVGYLAVPLIGLAVFLVLPVFYGITSAGLYQVPLARRMAKRSPPRA
jgi:uncharacterized membrane protein